MTLHLSLFICQQIEKEDYNFPALEWKCWSESNIQQNVTPRRPSMPSAKCLKNMEWTIMALQPCKETCCCVGMNAHGLQLRSLAGCLPGDTTLIVVYLPADRKRRLQFPALEWQCRGGSNIQQNVTPWGPEGLACLPPSALKRWSGQSWHCSHAKRLAAVLAWMHMASNLEA